MEMAQEKDETQKAPAKAEKGITMTDGGMG